MGSFLAPLARSTRARSRGGAGGQRPAELELMMSPQDMLGGFVGEVQASELAMVFDGSKVIRVGSSFLSVETPEGELTLATGNTANLGDDAAGPALISKGPLELPPHAGAGVPYVLGWAAYPKVLAAIVERIAVAMINQLSSSGAQYFPMHLYSGSPLADVAIPYGADARDRCLCRRSRVPFPLAQPMEVLVIHDGDKAACEGDFPAHAARRTLSAFGLRSSALMRPFERRAISLATLRDGFAAPVTI